MDVNLGMDLTLSYSAEDASSDVVIIGGGPAGATAAIYTARAGLKTLVIDRGLTVGALGITGKIANYPGILEEISGAELLERMRSQAQSFGAKFIAEKVSDVDLVSTPKLIHTNEGAYKGKVVIIATGSMGRGQRVKGEDRLLGHGVSYCATCDGAFYHEKEVAVAGNSDEAVEEGLYLTQYAARVHFLSPTAELRAPQHRVDELVNNPKVTLYKSAFLREINGEKHVEGVRYLSKGQQSEETLPVSGAFIYLQGGKPVTDFLKGQLDVSDTGCLNVDGEYQTSIPGVYAVGDVLCNHTKQAVVAAAEGAVAAMSVEKAIRGRKKVLVDWTK
jgi:thioredoxin reductase (NADPH)